MAVENIPIGGDIGQLSPSARKLFREAERFARLLPSGYVKKIVWDEQTGHAPQSWGVVQFSPRPFRQGYGCDGTTDSNIHLIATILCSRLGIDYERVYAEAYPDTTVEPGWTDRLVADVALREETIIPAAAGRDELLLMLSDLYQINNRSAVAVLEERLVERGFDVEDWYVEEERLRAWKSEPVAGPRAIAAPKTTIQP